MTLRPYQRDAIDGIHRALANGRSTLVVMPTGTGKTHVFSHLINETHGGRVLVLAHRDELIRQAAEKIHRVTGEMPSIEKAQERADSNIWNRTRVVVASVQTLHKPKRLQRFDPAQFGLVIIDEAHHATARTYRTIIEHFTSNERCKVLGVTATPDRGDEEALGQVFGTVAYDYEIEDAIRDGWLVGIKARQFEIEGLDYSSIRTVAGDFNGRELADVLEQERHIHEMAMPILHECANKKCLIFTVTVKQASLMADILNRSAPSSARYVCGKTPEEERRQILADYKADRFRYLCNVGVFTEGFDEPSIQTVVLCRPTKSRALFVQMVGRGTRPLTGVVDDGETAEDRRGLIAMSGKSHVEIIDYKGNVGHHTLVTPADILGGKLSPEVRARAMELCEDEMMDVEEALEQAEQERKEKERAELDELERRRRQGIKARVQWRDKSVDPFDLMGVRRPAPSMYREEKPATDAQIDKLVQWKVVTEQEAVRLTRSEASRLMGAFIQRVKAGKSTPGQIKLLRRWSIDATEMTKTEASATIDRIKKNGWKVA